MTSLTIMGFSDKHRALEVLTQLQRLRFDWCADFQNAVALEIEKDGRFRLHHNQILDPAIRSNLSFWKALINLIVPLPHVRHTSPSDAVDDARFINDTSINWSTIDLIDRDFLRDASSLFRPGSSAILATLRDSESAGQLLLGYSPLLLQTHLNIPEQASSPLLGY